MSAAVNPPGVRPLTAEQQKLVADPEFRMSVAELAAYYARRVRQKIHKDDFFQAGIEGAGKAARRYDSARGATFKTYAWSDVRGAMAALVAQATKGQHVADRGAEKFLGDAVDDVMDEDTDEDHRRRLETFSNGLVDHMHGAVHSEASRTAASGAESMLVERGTMRLLEQALDTLSAPARELIDLVWFEDGYLKDAVGRPGFPNYIKVRRVYEKAVEALRAFLLEHQITTAF